jgi:hypothetical protein
MSGELAVQGSFPIEIVQPTYGDMKLHDSMVGGGFMPRIQLMASNSRIVQNGHSKMGHYCIVVGKDTLRQDLGDTFHALVLGWRPKAMDFTEKAKHFFDPKEEGFRTCEQRCDAGQKKYVYGPEYLVYLPDLDLVCAFHWNTKSMRMRAAEMKSLIGKAATFKSEIAENSDGRWPVPCPSLCVVKLPLPESGSPDAIELWTRIAVEQKKFANPPKSAVEAEEVTDGSANAGPPR